MQIDTRVFGGMCVLCGCPSPPLEPCMLQLLKAPRQGRAVPGAARVSVALPRSLLGEGRRVAPFTAPELCKASVSMRSKKESSALMLCNVFFSSKCVFFPFLLPDLVYFFFPHPGSAPFLLCYDSTKQGERVLGGVLEWARVSFPSAALSQSGRGLFLAAAPEPAGLPESALPAHRLCASARTGHCFKALLLLLSL